MFHIDRPQSEPTYSYEPNSKHRESLKRELDRLSGVKTQIPCVIGGREITTGEKRKVVMPHDHQHVLGEFYYAGRSEMEAAVAAALKAKPAWEAMGWEERAGIFLRAA